MKTGIFHGYLVTMLLAVLLQQTGFWALMLIAGAAGSVFTPKLQHSFIAGFLGVATAWSIIFLYLNYFAQAYVIAEWLASLIGIPGFGRYIVSLSILLGGFLGGFGGLSGRAFLDVVDEIKKLVTRS